MHSIYYTFAIFTDHTDEKVEVAHVPRFRDYIGFELDRRDDPLRKHAFPKYWPRSRAGDESPGTVVGTVPIYTPRVPTKAISRAKLPFRTANHLELFIVIYPSSGISIRVRKDADRNWLLEKKKRCCLGEIETLRLTLSARLLLPFSSRQKWVARNDWYRASRLSRTSL